MNRTLALKMALVMLNKSLENKITLEEFKQTTDSILLENKNMKNHNSIEYEEDTGTYNKAQIFFFLFNNMAYYKTEETLFTFGSYLVSLCSGHNHYNAISKVIWASLEDIQIDLARRVEIEVLTHLCNAVESYTIASPEYFKTEFLKYISQNICIVERLTTLDIAESLDYTQETIPNISFIERKEKLKEKVSKTNYYRKEKVVKRLRSLLVRNYNEETFFEFCTEISTLIDSLNLPIYDKSILSKKYNDQIKSLYEYLAPIWNAKKIEDKYQLSLF